MGASPEDVSSQLPGTPQTGGFHMPDTSDLDKQIAAEQQAATGYEQQSAEQALKGADFAEQQAKAMPQQQSQLDALLKQYPTRAVAYGAAMHNAPILAVLTAMGGKLTRLNGLEMLGATNGIVQGLNQGAESQFEESVAKWNAAYQRQKELFAQQMQVQQLMLTAYKGRADAYQKASDAARRMTGDLLEQKQEKIKNQIDIAKLNQGAMAQLDKSSEAWAKIAVEQKKLALERQKFEGFQGPVGDLLAAMAQQGVSFPPGIRSKEEMLGTAQSLIRQHPDKQPAEIAQLLKAGKIGMKVTETEATQAARKEASVESAMEALNRPGGLFEQLDAAAKRVNFGDSKTANKIRLAMQREYVDDPAIQFYVGKLIDARTELGQVFTKTGQATDVVRAMAEHALPEAASYASIQSAIRASKEASKAVIEGNESYIDRLIKGATPQKASIQERVANPPTFNNATEAETARRQQRIKPGDLIIVNGVPGTWEDH